MPRYTPYRSDGDVYIVKDDRTLPPGEQTRFLYRDPLPSEIAEFEDSTGYSTFGGYRVAVQDGESVGAMDRRWHSAGASNRIRALLRFLTGVEGSNGNGEALSYPAPGEKVPDGQGGERNASDADRERFLAGFAPEYLYEVSEHILERRHLSRDAEKNSETPPIS